MNPNDKAAVRNFSLYPLAWASAFVAIGIWAANLFKINLAVWLLLLAVPVLLTFFCLRKRNLTAATVFLLPSFIILGGIILTIEKSSVATDRIQNLYQTGVFDFKTSLEITGVLENEPEAAVGGSFLTLKAEKIAFKNSEQKASSRVRLFVAYSSDESRRELENLELRYGARVRALTKLTREDRYRNPGYTPFEQILASKNLDATGSVKSPLLIERLDDSSVFLPVAWLYDWRAHLVNQFRQHFSPKTAGVLAASLLNNRYFLSKETSERFREGGTFHILVISGLHITFIGAGAVWALRRFTKKPLLQFAVANSLLWTYSLMVGAEIPVVRAALMFTVFHAAELFNRNGTSLNSFGASVLALLVWRPSDLFDQSFHLTVLSVAAIVAFAMPLWEKMRQIGAWEPSTETPAPPVCSKWLKSFCETLFWSERRWQREQKRTVWKCRLFKSETAKRLEKWHLQTAWQFVFGSVLVSAIVSLWLLPLMAVYFHRFSTIGLFLNLFVGALMAIESLAAVAALLVLQINSTLAQPLIWICEALNRLMISSGEPFSGSSWASFRLPLYPGFFNAIYAFYFLPLIIITFGLNSWNPFQIQNSKFKIQNLIAPVAQSLLIILILVHPYSQPRGDGRLRIDFLDVGQGDAALLTMPNGTTVLIDAGGKSNFSNYRIQNADGEFEFFDPDTRSIGEGVVSEFLWEKGYDSINFLLPTHADTDHIDGLNDVARNFKVEAVLIALSPSSDAEFDKFSDSLNRRKIQPIKISRGDRLEIGGATLEILHPPEMPKAEWDNNNSAVARISFGSRCFLLTGDVEKEGEQILLNSFPNLSCDVVKVAHHGSKTSSTQNFVAAANARFAVISVGRDSPFGHPHREIVERWRAAGAQVLSTGENGTISFSTDGGDLRLETFVKNN